MRQRVFEHVRANGAAARADITRALDISAGSATTLTADLIAAGYLCEVVGPPREQGRGRPPVALAVVPEAAHVIGIKLSYKSHTAVLTNFAGEMIADLTLPASDKRLALPDLMEEVVTLIDRLLALRDLGREDIHAVGIGMPGIIDPANGLVHWSSLLQNRDENLAAAFAVHFDMPVYLDNDANALTLGELWFGAGRAMSDFAVVTIENGVGMGMVLDNCLYRGAHGMGLELGHTKVQLDGALCRCGQRGCLEAYLADYALTREAAVALDYAFDDIRSRQEVLDVLLREAEAGQTAARTIFRRAGRYLSLGLSNVVQLFDPELIILSGERMQHGDLFVTEIMEEMQEMTLSEGRKPCKVAIHPCADLVWARGATALALSALTDTLLGGEAAVG
ncbi:ROK family protein [Sulfitobacter sp. JB4-11]|uniref:ROK family protein n=1 Tax=Sulfitobacter rhodophyticola TaxID=3238304 RepID=UPI003517E4E8